MKTATLKVVRIGNSRGVRLPAPLLARYRIKHDVAVEERPEGLLLRPVKDNRLSWEETARAMATERDGELAAWEKAAASDGLSSLDK
jgi:antitoxin MazE